MSHRIYRKVYEADGTTLASLRDELTTEFIPLDPDNRHYAKYLALTALNRALALDEGEALPNGVTATDE